MFFALFLTFARITAYYGDIPEFPDDNQNDYELFELDYPHDQDLLLGDFVRPINDLCNTTLALGDVDWFDAEKCALLRGWLEERLRQPCDDRLRYLYGVLLDYATRAIELNTGVKVTL